MSEERVGAHQLVEVRGLRVTDALRSTVYEMRHSPSLAGAVEAADMAATSDLVSRDELAVAVAAHRAWTGVEQARRALALMAENSWSPAESRLRLRWLQWSGERALLCNQPVFDLQGRHVGTSDLLDARAGVLGEYDGDDHWNRERRRGDLSRLERFQDLGLEVVTFVAGESDRDVADRLRGAYGRAALRPAADRAWTLRAPTWWQPTTTVALRRSLEPAQRRRLLGRQQPAA
ncbi:hypothetical protein [Nocardioides bruguierae]|uniref:DUF559 domain-containing protein n=1 Tax=Nocardioides bruguierae TaxID=2945102 RepID=A0A9X2D916_9ACTN|nr:hypothetical protein [Nocardioides bruguierae]MCM0621566.1 hypothetical protein [Nocardioides bruguierae]